LSLVLTLAAASGGGCSVLVEGELVDKPTEDGGQGGDASTAAQTSTAAQGSATQSSSGTGGLMCKEGTADCDGFLWDGCEAKLKTDLTNCGACKHVCQLGTKCEDGICK
jgi:hypothetical protein